MNASDKVVCVDDKPHPTDGRWTIHDYWMPGGMVKKGEVYCVERIIFHPRTGKTGVVIVGKPLIGMDANGNQCGEAGWSPHRFRKIEELKVSTTTGTTAKHE